MDFKQFKLQKLISPIDERDYDISMLSCVSTEKLPDNFSLTYQFDAKNQGKVNSCVGHSVSEWFEIAFKSSKQFSPGFIYGNRDENEYPGTGWYNRLAFKHAVNEGVALLEDMPFNLEVPDIIKTVKENQILFEKAKKHKAASYIKLNNVDEIKRFIYDTKTPVVISVAVYDSFYDTKSDGLVPKCSGKKQGFHSVLILGWREDGRLIMLNSWSNQWGDNGYGYLLTDDPNLITEAWGATAEKIDIPTTDKKEKLYRVRVGGYSKEVAQAYAEKLTANGVISALMFENGQYVVQCGSYKNKENAIATKNKIADILISIEEKEI